MFAYKISISFKVLTLLRVVTETVTEGLCAVCVGGVMSVGVIVETGFSTGLSLCFGHYFLSEYHLV